MPGGPIEPDPHGDPTPQNMDQAREYLAAVLRTARSDAIEARANPDAVTADLQERLLRVRQMLAADPGDA